MTDKKYNMNRAIKYRGQSIDTKEWVYGYYHQDPEDSCFITDFEYVNVSGSYDEPPSGYFKKVVTEVVPESVGQFTGLKDRDGKGVEVYEGDKIGRTSFFDKLVIWEKCGFYTISVNNPERKFPLTHLDEFDFVIGNIFENPELLK